MTLPAGGAIGILGGMGPAATVDFYRKLIDATPAGRDQESRRVTPDQPAPTRWLPCRVYWRTAEPSR
jgi:hypothetical protein